MNLTKADKRAIKNLLRIAESRPECAESMKRSIVHIFDRARNPEKYRAPLGLKEL